MEKIKQALVAGHICLDVIPNFDQLPTGAFAGLFQPGHLVTVGNAAFSTGGPVSNTGLALHILGIPTRLVAKVGADFFGKVICDLVDQRDPNLTGGIVVDAGETDLPTRSSSARLVWTAFSCTVQVLTIRSAWLISTSV